MAEDRLARLHTLIEQWNVKVAVAFSNPEADPASTAFWGGVKRCAAELEGVLADPPQGEYVHWYNCECQRCIEKRAAPTPADGAPQEQEP